MAADLPVGFITVRTSSSRLPKKCLLPFGDCNVIEHVIRRARHYGIDPIVCTSTDPSDDILEKIAESEKVRCFRGSMVNKLKRWSDCASYFRISAFHTVDADDPFFDGDEMKRSMQLLADGKYDMICPTPSSSAGGASVGYSLTADVVKQACTGLSDEADTEMMWYYVEKIKGLRSVVLPETQTHQLKLRLTLDYDEDYWLLASICRMLGNLAHRDEILQLFAKNPDLYKINWFLNDEWKAAQKAKKI